MSNEADDEYFARRAESERSLSLSSSNPVTAGVHAELAAHYERRVSTWRAPRPKLRIVTPAG